MTLPRNPITLLLDASMQPANGAAEALAAMSMASVFTPIQADTFRSLGFAVEFKGKGPMPMPVLGPEVLNLREKAMANPHMKDVL